jgi:hypothetical protein
MIRGIKIDNSAVVRLANKIKEGKYIQWNKLSKPELARMLKNRIE